jgi:hypothetical protein
MSSYPVNLPESEWQAKLTPMQFKVLRQKGMDSNLFGCVPLVCVPLTPYLATEPPRSGEYNKHYESGVYLCAGCETPLCISSSLERVASLTLLSHLQAQVRQRLRLAGLLSTWHAGV